MAARRLIWLKLKSEPMSPEEAHSTEQKEQAMRQVNSRQAKEMVMSGSTSRFTKAAVILALAAIALMAPQSALADTTVSTWNGGTADWATGTNWDANGVPSITTSAKFDALPAN
jgi:hypothetical protein